jgi:hypothetical protein
MSSSTERRKPSRKSTYLRALSVTRDGARTVDVRVEDVSESGAKIAINKGQVIPEQGYLIVAGKEFAHEAEIVWTRPHEIGVKFLKTHTMESLKSGDLQFLRRLKLERLRG